MGTYERELIGLVKEVRHWRPYLWERAFLVRTDHYSLKFLLDQQLSTIPQHTWVSKLFGYDFSVEFRPGQQNATTDALSHRNEETLAVWASSPTFNIFAALQQGGSLIPELVFLRDKVLASTVGVG